MKLQGLQAMASAMSDLTPLRGMPLKDLDLHDARVTSIDPLAGMPLEYLNLTSQRVSDLSTLRGMTSLRVLNLNGSAVEDLGPLNGLKLRELYVQDTRVRDLTPLQGMELRRMTFSPKTITRGMDVVRGMASLKVIGIALAKNRNWAAAEFWVRYDRGEFTVPRRPDPDVVRRLSLKSLEGLYRHEPMGNRWHEGRISREGRAGANGGPVYRWSNRIGKSWRLTYLPGTLTLHTGPDNPYDHDKSEDRHQFTVELKTDGTGSYLPEVAGFWFDSTFYRKVGP